ncbi:MAG: hypothetical protein RLZZ175_2785 [Bacteroidota bacterium]|jgi:hypothetical protein
MANSTDYTGRLGQQNKEITYFNTVRFWWVFWHKETDKLYNQYGKFIMNNATQYLQNGGFIDADLKVLKDNDYPKN